MTSIIYFSGGGVLPATITKLQNFSWTGVLNPGPTSLNYNISTFGPTDPTRRIWVVVVGTNAGNLTGITIAGVPATSHTTYTSVIRIYSALVPTGASGTAVLSFASTVVKNLTLWAFSTTNIINTTPSDYAENFLSATGSMDLSTDTITGGILIGAVWGVNSTTFSVTGINAEQNFTASDRHWAAWEETPATATPQAISSALTTGGGGGSAGVILAFR